MLCKAAGASDLDMHRADLSNGGVLGNRLFSRGVHFDRRNDGGPCEALQSRDLVGQLEYRFAFSSVPYVAFFPFNLFLFTPPLSFHSALITLCRLYEVCLEFFYRILYHSYTILIRKLALDYVFIFCGSFN